MVGGVGGGGGIRPCVFSLPILFIRKSEFGRRLDVTNVNSIKDPPKKIGMMAEW
jgi:hypothetical protein